MMLAPSAAYLQQGAALRISTFETSQANFEVGDQRVRLEQQGDFPERGHSLLIVHCAHPTSLSLAIRVPGWAAPLHAGAGTYAAGWAELPGRRYQDGDRIEFDYQLSGRAVPGTGGNAAHIAFAWGPFVLAAEAAANAQRPLGQWLVLPSPPIRNPVGTVPLAFEVATRGTGSNRLQLLPFADAGADGSAYQVWLAAAP
jgi:DUF1680 family protein